MGASLSLMETQWLLQWAREQAGPFRAVDAHASGHSRRCIAQAVGRGLRDMGRGILLADELWQAADARGRHRWEVAARLLQKRGRWLGARRSSAVFHGLPLLGDHVPEQPQLLRGLDGSRSSGVDRHERIAPLDDAERTEVCGVPNVDLTRTVFDLAREEEFRSGLIVADGALRRGLDRDALIAMISKRSTWPGALAAMKVAQLANGLHETPLESLSWAACVTLGIPVPEPQIRIFLGDKQLARVDGLWRGRNTVGQADGQFKYKSQQDVIRDKLQDESLEDVGLEVVRWGWSSAYRPEGDLDAKLERAFARGDRQELDPRVHFVPTTLKESLRWTGLIAS